MKLLMLLMILVGLSNCSYEEKKQKDPLGVHEKKTYELK